MENWIIVFGFAIGLVAIIKGGDYFVDAASWASEASGIPKFIVGATIVSLATTLPEIIVSSMAAYNGSVDMAIGNSIGSIIANTGMILAISIIFMPVVFDRSKLIIKAVLFMVIIAALGILSMSGQLTLGKSLVLFALFGFFIYENIKSARELDEDSTESYSVPKDRKTVIINIIKFVVGTLGIVIGSRLLVNNGTELAIIIGIPESVVGLTAVAIGTSLPELVTTINAIIRKEFSLSAGNIIGANIINATLILPICAMITNGAIPVSARTLILDLPVALVIAAIALIPALIKGRFQRWQGFTVLGIYIAYVVCLF
ncbi:calcium/sodium antiporter [Alloiococcus sp. CFN-8]|uniref:calcium/sodium antiporter n=1 Tax=Alloiococcus sp. CFN-8 TaxID=3416081 RepID=UPI003CE9ED7D